jgi:hypothetical protein
LPKSVSSSSFSHGGAEGGERGESPLKRRRLDGGEDREGLEKRLVGQVAEGRVEVEADMGDEEVPTSDVDELEALEFGQERSRRMSDEEDEGREVTNRLTSRSVAMGEVQDAAMMLEERSIVQEEFVSASTCRDVGCRE